MVNVHASGGRAMMEAARKALPANSETLLIAVTVPAKAWAMKIFRRLIYPLRLKSRSLHLLRWPESEMDGVVCSAMETSVLNAALGDDFGSGYPWYTPGRENSVDDRKDYDARKGHGQQRSLSCNKRAGHRLTTLQKKLQSIMEEISTKT